MKSGYLCLIAEGEGSILGAEGKMLHFARQMSVTKYFRIFKEYFRIDGQIFYFKFWGKIQERLIPVIKMLMAVLIANCCMIKLNLQHQLFLKLD